jgi:D-alanine transaminase
MSIAYLNGDYIPLEEARISPLDRGFLFGEGIYEVIPSYAGRLVGFDLHMQRMEKGLGDIALAAPLSYAQWRNVVAGLLERNELQDAAVYLHVSRGADSKRSHGAAIGLRPTIFAFVFAIPPAIEAQRSSVRGFKVVSTEDFRWKRCHIKSTSLLGNLLHYQQGQDSGGDECILYNERKQLTEASSSNVFVIRGKKISTPPVDNQILPGITRHIVLDILRQQSDVEVRERPIAMAEVHSADELWLCSSSKGIVPVTLLDGVAVGSGNPGELWQWAQGLYLANKFNY